MTDAAVSVTQSAVEHFTEQYLRSLDCSIAKDGDRWEVTVPENAATALPPGKIVLICGDQDTQLEANQEELYPQSSFFQELLVESSESHLIGEVSVDLDTEIELPPWLKTGGIKVKSTKFTPYYDRNAVILLYRVSIETVSEYQRELLQAVALDERTLNPLPALENEFLQQTSPGTEVVTSRTIEVDENRITDLVDETRERVVDRLHDEITEIHQEASRAADAELEEYRQMQEQRLEELEGKLSTLTANIDKLSNTLETGSSSENRVEKLKERKQLRAEKDDIESELQDLQQQREQGFPEKQREIRDRHDLEAVVTPLTVSKVDYERGELEIELLENNTTRSMTVGYGEGIGIADEIQCEHCGEFLSKGRPLHTIKTGFVCKHCANEG
jgi:DNA repair exonuclease SbcCD ATPase subunit